MFTLRARCAYVLLLPGLLAGLGCDLFPHQSNDALDCEVGDYPCSLSDVPLDVLVRSDELGVSAKELIENGATVADAVAWLQSQEGVVDVAGNEFALRFRLAGGRDVFVLRQEALAPAVNKPQSKPLNADVAAPAKSALPRAHVVGDVRGAGKKALVLSPFKWQFGADDDAEAVGQMLAVTPDYEDGVLLLQNETADAKVVGIEQFSGWDAYDVVHVSSHGMTICDLSFNCAAVIFTGDTYATADELLQITEAGVNTAHVTGDDKKGYVLSADFFRTKYPGGLDKTIVVFSACQTFDAGDSTLAEAIIGDDSIYLGWNNPVEAQAASTASIEFYKHLIDEGVTGQVAYELLGNLRDNNYEYLGDQIEARLFIVRPEERDLRIREVVTLEDTLTSARLTPETLVYADGHADDGVTDLFPYQVLIDGIEEGQEDAFVVQVSVGSFASTPSPASAGEKVGARGRRLSGKFPVGELTHEQTVEVRATLQLPEGGTSEQVVTVNLIAPRESDDNPGGSDGNDDQPTREVWSGTATSVYSNDFGGAFEKRISATFVFEQTPESVGQPIKHFTIREGTMLWSISGEIVRAFDDPCPYNDGPVSVPILASDGQFKIDTTTTPPTYTFFGSTDGPEVRAATQCGDEYAYTTTADGVWGYPVLNSDKRTVSGGVITGDAADNLQSWSWTLTRQ